MLVQQVRPTFQQVGTTCLSNLLYQHVDPTFHSELAPYQKSWIILKNFLMKFIIKFFAIYCKFLLILRKKGKFLEIFLDLNNF